MLMIEVDGSEQSIAESRTAVLRACGDKGLIKGEEVSDTTTLWAARKALSPLLRDIAPENQRGCRGPGIIVACFPWQVATAKFEVRSSKR